MSQHLHLALVHRAHARSQLVAVEAAPDVFTVDLIAAEAGLAQMAQLRTHARVRVARGVRDFAQRVPAAIPHEGPDPQQLAVQARVIASWHIVGAIEARARRWYVAM